jgi:hypothetical protein
MLTLKTKMRKGKHEGQTVKWLIENDFKYFERYIFYKEQSSRGVYALVSQKLDLKNSDINTDDIVEKIKEKTDFTNLLGG